MLMNPQPIRSTPLHIDKTIWRLPIDDFALPAEGDTMKSQPVINQGTGPHFDVGNADLELGAISVLRDQDCLRWQKTGKRLPVDARSIVTTPTWKYRRRFLPEQKTNPDLETEAGSQQFPRKHARAGQQ